MSIRRKPFEEMEKLVDRVSREFGDVSQTWNDGPHIGVWPSRGASMAVDLVELQDEFLLSVDLPGFEREDVELRLADETLTIEADHEAEMATETDMYHRRERRQASVTRSIPVPTPVEADAVTAKMVNGVLTVRLPKLDITNPTNIDIE